MAAPSTWCCAPTPASEEAAQEPAAKKGAKNAAKEPKPKVAKIDAPAALEGTKRSVVLELLRREKGATNEQIRNATNWQPHSVRGFISGNLVKKMGFMVDTITRADGNRAYH